MNDASLTKDSERRIPFLITIDTEGDNLWAKPHHASTHNARHLPRFQGLCEQYHLKPTYVVDYDMIRDCEFQQFAADVLRRQTAEVGAHPHAWNTPPLTPLTDDDDRFQPFLIEYPEALMREKVRVLTTVLEDALGVKMLSHRAGRWSFNAAYARILVEAGYLVDCSVTPRVCWRFAQGAPQGTGGTDFSNFPAAPYFVNPDDISRPGESPLLEVPVSTARCTPRVMAQASGILERSGLTRNTLVARVSHKLAPVTWLRPTGRNLAPMVTLVQRAIREGWAHLEFMLHSSELMPGGSPTFPTSESIEHLYHDMDALFASASRWCRGMTLSEFRQFFMAR